MNAGRRPEPGYRGGRGLAVAVPILAAGLAIYPLLPPGIPSTADGPLHLIRSVEFDALLHRGILYPRWAPDLAYGYGYPLFNYYAPLFYYLTEIPHLLGASFELSLKLVIFGAFLLYGLAVYWWTRPFLGEPGAAVAGTAYIFVPFRFHEAYMQGDYPQFLALALAPLALGALDRLLTARRVTPGRILGLTAAFATVLLVHNISTLWVGLTLALYAAVRVAVEVCQTATRDAVGGKVPCPSEGSDRLLVRLAWIAATAVLALGLTAFFWLPALAEQNVVQLYRLRTDDYDVRHSFITLATLLAPPAVVDQTAANPPPYLHLGWGQLALSLATLPLAGLVVRAARRSSGIGLTNASLAHLIFGWSLLLGSAVLTIPISTPVWRLVPLLAYTQFPWRVLELSGLATALLAGVAVHLALALAGGCDAEPGRAASSTAAGPAMVPAQKGRLTRARAVGIVGTALALVIVPSLVYLYPREPFLVYGALTAADVTGFERQGGAVGTTSTGEYYPRTVTERPRAPLPADLDQIGRLDRAVLPTGSVVVFEGSQGYAERYRLFLPRPATLRFDLILFPGWQVDVDGRPVAVRPSPGQGLLLADVPAGQHILVLEFVDTPVRQAGWTIAAVSLGILLALGGCYLGQRLIRRQSPPGTVPETVPYRTLDTRAQPAAAPLPDATLDRRGVVVLGGGILALLSLRATSPAPYAAIFARRSPLDRVIGAGHPMRVRLEDKIEFLGYDLSTSIVPQGGSITLRLYWRALHALDRDYRSLAMIARVGDKGLLTQDDRVHPGGVPTSSWRTDHYTIDEHTLAIPAAAPPMVYQLQVALYDPRTLQHLRQDGRSGWEAEQIVLQEMHVIRRMPLDLTAFRSLGEPVFGGIIRLLGYQVSADHLRAGQTLVLTLVWQADHPISYDYTVFTHLIDRNQQQVAGHDSMPIDGQYPTSTWLVGEPVVDVHPIRLPSDLPADRYHLAFGIYDARTLQRLMIEAQGGSSPRSQIDLDLPIIVEPAR